MRPTWHHLRLTFFGEPWAYRLIQCPPLIHSNVKAPHTLRPHSIIMPPRLCALLSSSLQPSSLSLLFPPSSPSFKNNLARSFVNLCSLTVSVLARGTTERPQCHLKLWPPRQILLFLFHHFLFLSQLHQLLCVFLPCLLLLALIPVVNMTLNRDYCRPHMVRMTHMN